MLRASERNRANLVLTKVIDQKEQIMENRSDTAQGVGTELLADAKDVGASAANRLHSEVDARKGEAATQVKSLSSAIDKATESLDDNAPAWLVSAFKQGSQHVQKFAETLEQKDSRELVNEVSTFARNSPGTFLAACAAVGFAAARVLKAGSSENTPTQPQAIGLGNSGVGQPTSSRGGTGTASGLPRGEFA